MSKILITGASGFVGSFLVEEALKNDKLEVYAGIRSSSSKKWLQDSRIKFVELDLSNREGLALEMKQYQFDYIIHNAGLTKATNINDLYKVNADFTKNLAEASMHIPGLKKFSFMSSLAAYGTADYQDDAVVSNDSKPHPVTSYGRSKLRAERFLKEVADLPYVLFRPTGIFGPRESDFLTIFKSINKGVMPKVGFSEQMLTLIYVKDLVRIILKATLSDQSRSEYFVTDGNLYPGSKFNSYIANSLNAKPWKITIPIPVVMALAMITDGVSKITGKPSILSMDKLAELKSVNFDCDISNLVRDHDFVPEYDLATAVQETTDWYQDNQWL